MSPSLLGLHDRESVAVNLVDCWCLDTIALADDPGPMNYGAAWHWITRVNWSYGSTGTIPLPDKDAVFLSRLSKYVSRSSNCRRWVIGNEPNLPREWPKGQPIHPHRYGEFFVKCHEVITKLPGHEQDEVLIAVSGPWNAEYRYPGNFNGDWVFYFLDQINSIPADKIGGFAIHAYTHGYAKELVRSEAVMGIPFQSRHYNFRSYRDYCNTIPDALAHLPIYITEANGNGPWQAVGLMPAMGEEIDEWNQKSQGRKIKALIFYRYPKYDSYNIEGKPDVIKEYKEAVAKGFKSPLITRLPVVQNEPPKKAVATVSAPAGANIRSGPGTSYKILGAVAFGGTLPILGRSADSQWWVVQSQFGSGWVSVTVVQTANAGDVPTIDFVVPKPPSDPQTNWQRCRAFTKRWEGGFQDVDWDAGNWTGCEVGLGVKKGTNRGISACSYPNLDIRNLTQEQADKIFYEDYWLRSGADKLEWPLCLLVYDTAVNFHPTTARLWLQESDGDMLKFVALRLRGYRRSKAWAQAGDAWVDRVIDIMLEATKD